MMPVVSGQGRTENYQIESSVLGGFDDSLSADRYLDFMACLLP